MREPINIVLFSDGTGNSSGKLFRTNVWRTYQALDLADPQDLAKPRQFAFYDNGVGTSSFKPYAILGGAIGLGLARNVRHLYSDLCRTYRPGDRIYAFGFSRGAFTIRVLTGLICTEGLVAYDGREALLSHNVANAYRRYRAKHFRTRLGLVHVFRKMRDGILGVYDRLFGYRPYDTVEKIGAPSSARPIEIAFLGLWDTVDAYGLPVDEMTRAIDRVFWPLSMPTPVLSGQVRMARHALGLDDERNTFHPKLWTETPADAAAEVAVDLSDPEAPGRTIRAMRRRIDQVWFAGVHSNIGGGYPDDSLSYVPLLWILRAAGEAGLRFCPDIVESYRQLSDENGPIYDSRKGLASYYRYNPRRIATILAKEKVTLQAVRIHESVFRRIAAGEDGYAPLVLPPSFDVVRIDGTTVSADAYLGQPGRILSPETEQVWNAVWRRRVAYFATLLVSLALAAAPLYFDWVPEGACRSSACFVSPAIEAVEAFLPSYAATWLNVFSANPGRFLVLVAGIGLGLGAGSIYAARIADGMRAAWYTIPATRPADLTPVAPGAPGRVDRAIQRLRLSGRYQDGMRAFTQTVLPGIFVVLFVLAGWALASQFVLTMMESTGATCSTVVGENGPFRTSAVCAIPDGGVRAGSRYQIALTIQEEWFDLDPFGITDGVPAGPNGVAAKDVTALMKLSAPLRRHLGQAWFKLMVRVGATGSDIYDLDWRRVSPIPSGSGLAGEVHYLAEMTARTGGQLYVYVNDAVLLPFPPRFFYSRNRGSAEVVVTLVSETH